MLSYNTSVGQVRKSDLKTTTYGGIAQLGERLNGIQEVSGSIPLISTKKSNSLKGCWIFSLRIDCNIVINYPVGKRFIHHMLS